MPVVDAAVVVIAVVDEGIVGVRGRYSECWTWIRAYYHVLLPFEEAVPTESESWPSR